MVTNMPPSPAEIEITNRDILESSMTQRWENFKGGAGESVRSGREPTVQVGGREIPYQLAKLVEDDIEALKLLDPDMTTNEMLEVLYKTHVVTQGDRHYELFSKYGEALEAYNEAGILESGEFVALSPFFRAYIRQQAAQPLVSDIADEIEFLDEPEIELVDALDLEIEWITEDAAEPLSDIEIEFVQESVESLREYWRRFLAEPENMQGILSDTAAQVPVSINSNNVFNIYSVVALSIATQRLYREEEYIYASPAQLYRMLAKTFASDTYPTESEDFKKACDEIAKALHEYKAAGGFDRREIIGISVVQTQD